MIICRTIKFINFTLILTIIILSASCHSRKNVVNSDEEIDYITSQVENSINAVNNDPTRIPRTITEDGKLRTVGIYGWTSGFFAGNLWYLYDLTGDDKWRKRAIKWTEALDSVQYYTEDHDIGFIINCSYGNGLRLAGIKEYEKVIINAAKSLTTRYNPITKSIKSWNRKKAWDGETEWYFPVIIDNMMNLELLFEATRLSGDNTFKDIAVQHALTTMQNHYRKDFSSYHVVDYDTITGNVLDKATNQGFVDQSSWARGQAWGLYGFITCYRYTKDEQFLQFAENIANYILNHPNLPEDLVPYWDYDATNSKLIPEWDYDPEKYPVVLRDVSAAAITCSALFELAEYNIENSEKYKNKAFKLLESLASSTYMNTDNENNYFILNHSVGSLPHGAEINAPLVYADYYFLESIRRKKKVLN
ncbi:glycoside hydrolase family 88 protein [Arenibacter sp. S6351L]|uniref:glycoside hydrolase family 88 protein n=1 Tax=Arenibacter sp. S6351L TaxID=2926407 RepID=UPI001FF0F6AC|nr:glycoside hydrolase family 88 protein [Arenibacter sp. S6351L]MCK0135364.1 glycoside hydrolase family 88 protein [Arenibacter sp. S6351L]